MSKSNTFPEGYLLYLLARASHFASLEFHQQLRDEGVDYKTWRILASLSEANRNVGELADMSLFTQSALSKALDRLEEEGLVARKSSTQSRRHVSVAATASGKRLVAKLKLKAQLHEESLLSRLSKSDQRYFKSLLRDLIDDLSSGKGG